MVCSGAGPTGWQAIIDAARTCVGTRFRPQGRVPGLGLDCVGVVLVAAAAAGVIAVRLPVYRLGGVLPDADAVFAACGARRVEAAMPGDVLDIVPAPRQRHFGIIAREGLIHAHAGLERVVEAPVDPDWKINGAWRLPGAR